MATRRTAQPALEPDEVLPSEAVTDRNELDKHQSDAAEVGSFFSVRNLVKFVAGAKAIEKKAADFLGLAKITKEPTTETEDAEIQRRIRSASAEMKATETYWGITGVLSSLHRATVAGRKRGHEPFEAGRDIYQRHHDSYVRKAREAAAAADRERQRLADEEARAQRQRQYDELSRAREAAEDASVELSERERAFVELVFRGSTPEIAAKACGYANPPARAGVLMGKATIANALEGLHKAREIDRQEAALRAQPVMAEAVEPTRPEVASWEGFDRTTRSAKLRGGSTEADLVLAIVQRFPTHAPLPLDVLQINWPALNAHARKLGPAINDWPHVELREKTRTV